MVNRWIPGGPRVLRTIRPHEVYEVLANARRWPRPAISGGLPALTIWGRTLAGRPLIVAGRLVGQLNQEIIGARIMTDAEVAEFEAWEATSDD